mmetsp:Transcript_102836/g.286350  ORF Transcript_102836/g.286350 Transcript_102836/m.286350 type:complete len:213 (+) Transcript_102836:80-718(+)
MPQKCRASEWWKHPKKSASARRARAQPCLRRPLLPPLPPPAPRSPHQVPPPPHPRHHLPLHRAAVNGNGCGLPVACAGRRGRAGEASESGAGLSGQGLPGSSSAARGRRASWAAPGRAAQCRRPCSPSGRPLPRGAARQCQPAESPTPAGCRHRCCQNAAASHDPAGPTPLARGSPPPPPRAPAGRTPGAPRQPRPCRRGRSTGAGPPCPRA